MSDTKSLLNRIAAFRERLEQTPALLGPLASESPGAQLQKAVQAALQPHWVGNALRQIAGAKAGEATALPAQLIGRAKRLLMQARELVADQRSIAEDIFFVRLARQHSEASPEPLVAYHRASVAATESTLKLAQALPESAELQSRACEGLETLLQTLKDRLQLTARSLETRRKEWGRTERLARLLCDIQARRLVSFGSFAELAEDLLDEARRGLPIRFGVGSPDTVARCIASHALTVGQVLARLVPHDFEWAGNAVPAVAVGLMMDVGMLTVPANVLNKTGELDDKDWRLIEAHVASGANVLRDVMPELGPLADAVAQHHERGDGSGYPKAMKGDDIHSLARLLAVADTYCAMASDRPHRPACDTRVALTDTLMLAEQGKLDRDQAELLLRVSFYPVGSVVELTDGRAAVVVSTHTGRVNVRATTRPVVAVLADAHGNLLPKPEFLDLAGSEYGGIVRSLTSVEKKKLLMSHHPDLCA